jgi:hypothetical protein
MALSHHEQRALERIAVELHADDPRLAAALAHDGWTKTRRRQRLAAAALFIAGMAMLACAIFVPPSIAGGIFAVSVLGYLVMFGAALMWCKGPPRPRRRAEFRNDGLGPCS